MPTRSEVSARLARVLQQHQRLHDPDAEPRNALPWLRELQRWQAQRLRRSFARFLDDPASRPAAEFFLSDLYGERDFARRDADVARVMPMMQGLLPEPLLATVADGIELGVLTHALDLDMAAVLQQLAPKRRRLDAALYAQAYRKAGRRRDRARQIALIGRTGNGLAAALRTPGVSMLLRLARGPAKALGVGELQGFLERGFGAFAQLGDARAFIAEIVRDERAVSRRLFAGDPDPFRD